MAFPFNDQVYTKSFTPREYQVELLYAARKRNIIVCLGKNTDRAFLVSKLIQEYARGNRRSPKEGGKRTLYLLETEERCSAKANHIGQLTDLEVVVVTDGSRAVDLENAGVATLTAATCSELLKLGGMSPSLIDLIIIDGCHDPGSRELLRRALRDFAESEEPPRVVALAAPLFDLTEQVGRLSLEAERLESAYGCEVETASDILSVLRYGPKPNEYVIEYDVSTVKTSLEERLESCALHAINFLRDHRYDPSEIYNDEFLEDIRKIPDPTEKPCEMMEAFLGVLRSLGAWCADRAALALLVQAEKSKIKTPYERHYLLLNMVSSVMMKIRALCDEAFEPLTERERILEHSRPKVHRLLATLRTFRPSREPASVEGKGPNNESSSSLQRGARRGGNRRWNDDSSSCKTRATTKPTRPSTGRHYRGGGGGGGGFGLTDPDLLCGIVFVDESFTAKILFHLLNDMSKCDEDFSFLSPLYAVERTSPMDGEASGNARDLESEHRKQEEVLKRFRIHECNLLIATSILEQGIEIPKCNFVVRYHFPDNYQSYVQCKSRARAIDALHVLLVPADRSTECVRRLARYHYIEKILLEKCWNEEPDDEEELEADAYAPMFPRYQPLPSEDAPGVTFNSAISLVNRYCAKLPSDTFTRLTPEWTMDRLEMDSNVMYTCSLRLPINSPLKYVVSSYAMPNRAMARRLAALQLCVRLHKDNEIDDSLSPIGKENFRARPEDAEVPALPDESRVDHSEARPGTTKRRQYYYKKTAEALTDCRPVVGAPAHLYHINMSLSCPLPEEQNTRGRRIYPPEESAIGFGILTLKPIPKLCPFPIYTRSGEVRVELRLCDSSVILDAPRIDRVATFLNYTFTNVLRLQKYLMLFDPNASENSYTIVPVKTATGGNDKVEVDWNFLERIYENRETIPREVPQDERLHFAFDPFKYHDAVIMPWYRNQDQPQYFYVAEICANLNPKSAFPGDGYTTFEEYYLKKYNIQIQNLRQPLLDVDHTSARLNFLTPRYVNRKGVALPTSSEETKRAKRENLEQKQILVAELCAIHPFPASLWRQAVCLPCILYRINALLLADQIRREVARSINLGGQNLHSDFQWPPLNFGWSLAEVLNRSRETEKRRTASVAVMAKFPDAARRRNGSTERRDTEAEVATPGDQLEIGTWSNEMAAETIYCDLETFDQPTDAPEARPDSANDGRPWGDSRYRASPTFDSNRDIYDSDETCSDDLGAIDYTDDYDSDEDEEGLEDEEEEEEEEEEDDDDDENNRRGLRISYMGENVAEAVEDETRITKREMSKKILRLLQVERESEVLPRWQDFTEDRVDESVLARHTELQREFTEKREAEIVSGGSLITADRDIEMERKRRPSTTTAVDALVSGRDRSTKDGTSRLSHENYVEAIAEKLRSDMCEEPLNVDDDEDDESSRSERASSSPSYVPDERLTSFDEQPELRGHPGPSPSLILQALTMSNANDGINLERLETIGDSFLKYAITTYLYCTYDRIHEGKLSHLRSKQVSNLNLYRLGRRKMLGESMIATKFEPHDNWLPPCYYVPKELEQALIESGVPSALWNRADIPSLRAVDPSEITQLVRETEHKLGMMKNELLLDRQDQQQPPLCSSSAGAVAERGENFRCFIPYNLITQHSIPDKSIADCVEALIGAYLIACGPRGALLFMAWLGINVLPSVREERLVQADDEEPPSDDDPGVTPYSKRHDDETGQTVASRIRYGKLEEPRNPLSRYAPEPERELAAMLDGYDRLELAIGYKFRDRSYLLQAFTHASYQPNRLTDCYQRLEFLGDAVLDYLITRHLYEDSRQHSPGALTDLRSALVNNTIFASLAVRCGFHKYFRHLSPGLNLVIDRFVRIQEENGHSISEEYYLIGEEDREEAEDVEVPKALGDVFESLAGAIYLDSRMSLDAVWAVYYGIMKSEIEQFSTNVPKSPIRELLELEPETAKFGKPEKLADGRRVRVTVDVFGKGSFKGIGRNYRIAKCTAAKCALKKLKRAQQHAPRRDKL